MASIILKPDKTWTFSKKKKKKKKKKGSSEISNNTAAMVLKRVHNVYLLDNVFTHYSFLCWLYGSLWVSFSSHSLQCRWSKKVSELKNQHVSNITTWKSNRHFRKCYVNTKYATWDNFVTAILSILMHLSWKGIKSSC